jgi:hypothetical protein
LAGGEGAASDSYEAAATPEPPCGLLRHSSPPRSFWRFFGVDRSIAGVRVSARPTQRNRGNGNRNRVGLEGAWEQVSSKIILKKNAVSVKERWGAGQLEVDHEKSGGLPAVRVGCCAAGACAVELYGSCFLGCCFEVAACPAYRAAPSM